MAEQTILFVCVHNAGRSRMAEAFFNHHAGDRYRGMSAGTEPAQHAHPEVVDAMERRGIPLRDGPGSLLSTALADQATKVIGMGCNVQEACPALRIPLEDWELEDPKGKPAPVVDRIRDDIEQRIKRLIVELDGAAT